MIIDSIDVCMAVHEFLYHALHSKARCQDEGRGAVIHAGIKLSCTVADQNLDR